MENQITTLGNKEEALSEQYDAANVTLGKDRKEVAAATKAVASANASAAKAKEVLTKDAINAYMHNGTVGASVLGGDTLKDANAGLLRAEYVSSLAADEQDAKDAYHAASLRAETAKRNLLATQATTESQMSRLGAARRQVMASQTQLEGVYHHETTQIANLVAEIQAQQQAAAQAAANARLTAEQQTEVAAAAAPGTSAGAAETTTATGATTTGATSTTATPASTSTTAPPTTATPASTPPPSDIGAAVVAAAESQVGVPYEWGGDTPGVGFDCSGLVMWAFAQVGISLPHFSGAQFAAGVQIPMSDLEPGDLVFFANPDDHVAIYVGGGDIVEAPTFGQDVHIVPMYSEFVQAVRIT